MLVNIGCVLIKQLLGIAGFVEEGEACKEVGLRFEKVHEMR